MTDNIRVSVDVGAYDGSSMLHIARQPGNVVIAFEPLPHMAKILYRHAEQLPGKYYVMPMALSDYDGCTTMLVTKYDRSSTILPIDQDATASWIENWGFEVTDRVVVPVARLDGVLHRLEDHWMQDGLTWEYDILKVDAQGCDLDVLFGAGKYLTQFKTVIAEVAIVERQPYTGAHTKDELVNYMTCMGFEVVSAVAQSNGQEENITFRNTSIG